MSILFPNYTFIYLIQASRGLPKIYDCLRQKNTYYCPI